MDEMPSSEFRRRYATLTQPVVVIVNGRPIGQYIPATTSIVYADATVVTMAEVLDRGVAPGMTVNATPPSFNSRPFTPAPKGK